MVMCPFYSMLPVKNTLMYLAIMYQPVEDGSYKASNVIKGTFQMLIACFVRNPFIFQATCASIHEVVSHVHTQWSKLLSIRQSETGI